ncbi:3'-5' exoribonuclease domain-containing protein [Escherichia coli]
MKHVMIDIEAMDNKPTAAIASIAAAIFDPISGEVSASMYRRIAIESSEAFGGTLGAVDLKPVWNFWNVRDVRTVEEVALTVWGYASNRLVDPEKHNAAADVWNQIAKLSDNLKSLAAKGAMGAAL